jgi:hypothetical protein
MAEIYSEYNADVLSPAQIAQLDAELDAELQSEPDNEPEPEAG